MNFFVTPIFEFSILRIVILVFVMILIFKLLPIKQMLLKQRATKFYNNWSRFKKILELYWGDKDKNLTTEYNTLQKKLMNDFAFFNKKIIEIQRSLHKSDWLDRILYNFEQCFETRSIEKWKDEVRRTIPKELDCFDYLLISLKENL